MKLTSRYKGVEYINSVVKIKKPWKATISPHKGGLCKWIGNFKTENEAAEAYNEIAKGHNMETNFITELRILQPGEDV